MKRLKRRTIIALVLAAAFAAGKIESLKTNYLADVAAKLDV